MNYELNQSFKDKLVYFMALTINH